MLYNVQEIENPLISDLGAYAGYRLQSELDYSGHIIGGVIDSARPGVDAGVTIVTLISDQNGRAYDYAVYNENPNGPTHTEVIRNVKMSEEDYSAWYHAESDSDAHAIFLAALFQAQS
jgi:hypothetical protein